MAQRVTVPQANSYLIGHNADGVIVLTLLGLEDKPIGALVLDLEEAYALAGQINSSADKAAGI